MALPHGGTLTAGCCPENFSPNTSWVSVMIDHLARAREMRVRAAGCKEAAKATTSDRFSGCYRLLAENYGILANLEEEYDERQNSFPENRYIPAR
jgi:hypothetical protein